MAVGGAYSVCWNIVEGSRWKMVNVYIYILITTLKYNSTIRFATIILVEANYFELHVMLFSMIHSSFSKKHEILPTCTLYHYIVSAQFSQ